jgi:hypothetical protein
MIKDKLKMAWDGVEMLLKKAERPLAGTPSRLLLPQLMYSLSSEMYVPLLFFLVRLLIIVVGHCRQQGCAGRTRD